MKINLCLKFEKKKKFKIAFKILKETYFILYFRRNLLIGIILRTAYI